MMGYENGWTVTPDLIDDLPVSGIARHLLKVLLRYKRQDACCWPKQSTLAHDLGVSIRTVYKALRELVSVGLLRVKRRGLNLTNQYFLDHGKALVDKLRTIIGLSPAPPAGELSTSDQERRGLPTTRTQGRYTPASAFVRGYAGLVNLSDEARAALVAARRSPQRRE